MTPEHAFRLHEAFYYRLQTYGSDEKEHRAWVRFCAKQGWVGPLVRLQNGSYHRFGWREHCRLPYPALHATRGRPLEIWDQQFRRHLHRWRDIAAPLLYRKRHLKKAPRPSQTPLRDSIEDHMKGCTARSSFVGYLAKIAECKVGELPEEMVAIKRANIGLKTAALRLINHYAKPDPVHAETSPTYEAELIDASP